MDTKSIRWLMSSVKKMSFWENLIVAVKFSPYVALLAFFFGILMFLKWILGI